MASLAVSGSANLLASILIASYQSLASSNQSFSLGLPRSSIALWALVGCKSFAKVCESLLVCIGSTLLACCFAALLEVATFHDFLDGLGISSSVDAEANGCQTQSSQSKKLNSSHLNFPLIRNHLQPLSSPNRKHHVFIKIQVKSNKAGSKQ